MTECPQGKPVLDGAYVITARSTEVFEGSGLQRLAPSPVVFRIHSDDGTLCGDWCANAKPSSKGTRELPIPFPITDAMAQWLRENCSGAMSHGVATTHGEFCDWAVAGGKRKKDWIAAWRNWMRRAYREGKLARRLPVTFKQIDAQQAANRPAEVAKARDQLFNEKPAYQEGANVPGIGKTAHDSTGHRVDLPQPETRPRLPAVASEGDL